MSIPDGAPKKRLWRQKFGDAGRGIYLAVREGKSFVVHLTMTVLVLLVSALLHMPRVDWCLILLCITIVWCAEILNSAMEALCRAITTDVHPEIGRALDMASGAVLVCSLGAASVGIVVFLSHLIRLLGA